MTYTELEHEVDLHQCMLSLLSMQQRQELPRQAIRASEQPDPPTTCSICLHESTGSLDILQTRCQVSIPS